ncbi:MAG: hypothetical protein JST85_26980 [Acidobacteria bacterium]|nr:hypothetical protein [Acidobacteriota bacterium]
MPDLNFQVYEAEAEPYAASPLLVFKLGIANVDPEELIHTVALRCQIQIETTRRRYTAEEQKQLRDLFGEPERWDQTLRTMLWTHTSAMVQSFTGSTIVNLPIPCTFDFNIAATKYFAGLETGEIPLTLQFSGTIFYADSDGVLQVAQISWSKEARYRMAVKIWHDMMEMYYPNSVWLRLRRDVFDRLYEYKMQRAIPTWEQTMDRILSELPAKESEGK